MNPSSKNGLFLHASSVVVGGGALLFLGHSTSGKSTISSLLKKHYPTLADDTVFATCDPRGIWQVVNGGFRFEDAGLCSWEEFMQRRFADGAIPLLGCMRIHKAQQVKVARLDPVETARYLMDAVMEVDVQRKFGMQQEKTGVKKPAVALARRMLRQWFQQSAEIARACPGWHLWFSRDTHLPDLLNALAAVAAEAQRQQTKFAKPTSS